MTGRGHAHATRDPRILVVPGLNGLPDRTYRTLRRPAAGLSSTRRRKPMRPVLSMTSLAIAAATPLSVVWVPAQAEYADCLPARDCVPNIQGARSQEVALLCEVELREACRVLSSVSATKPRASALVRSAHAFSWYGATELLMVRGAKHVGGYPRGALTQSLDQHHQW